VLTSENDGCDVNDVVNDDVIILESLDVLFLFIYCYAMFEERISLT